MPNYESKTENVNYFANHSVQCSLIYDLLDVIKCFDNVSFTYLLCWMSQNALTLLPLLTILVIHAHGDFIYNLVGFMNPPQSSTTCPTMHCYHTYKSVYLLPPQ